MPKGDELKFQGGTTSNTEREQGNEGRKNRDHAHDGRVPPQESLLFSPIWNFEQAQVCGFGEVVCSLSLLIRWAQRARCQAETPLIVLCRSLRPALISIVEPVRPQPKHACVLCLRDTG